MQPGLGGTVLDRLCDVCVVVQKGVKGFYPLFYSFYTLCFTMG